MPTATHGLKGKVAAIVAALYILRTLKEGGRNISLRQHLHEQYQLTPGHLFSEIGIDPERTTVDQLMADEDNRYLLPEIIRESMLRGMGLSQREQLAQLRRNIVSQAPVLSEANGGQRFISPEVFLDPVLLKGLSPSGYIAKPDSFYDVIRQLQADK